MTKKVVRKKSQTNFIYSGIIGILAVITGIFGILTGIKEISTLALIGAGMVAAIAVLEFLQMISASKSKSEFAFSLIRAGSGILIAVLLFINREQNMAWPLTLLSIYTIGRGILEILTALVFFNDKTKKMMFVVCGIAGCLLGIVSMNSGGFADKTGFFHIFSIYFAIYGMTELVTIVYSKKNLKA